MAELALTLPLDVAEWLLVMAMVGYADGEFGDDAIEAVKTTEREIEQVKRMAERG